LVNYSLVLNATVGSYFGYCVVARRGGAEPHQECSNLCGRARSAGEGEVRRTEWTTYMLSSQAVFSILGADVSVEIGSLQD